MNSFSFSSQPKVDHPYEPTMKIDKKEDKYDPLQKTNTADRNTTSSDVDYADIRDVRLEFNCS